MRVEHDEVQKKVGARIREARERRGLSQAAVSQQLAALGVTLHQTAVTRVESGRRPLSVVELLALADVLGVETDDLLHDQGERSAAMLRWDVVAARRRAFDAQQEALRAVSRYNELSNEALRLLDELVEEQVRQGVVPDADDARLHILESLGYFDYDGMVVMRSRADRADSTLERWE